MAIVEEIAIKLGFDADDVKKGVRKARTSLDRLKTGINNVRRTFNNAGRAAIGFGRTLRSVASSAFGFFARSLRNIAVIAAGVFAGITASIKGTADEITQLSRTAEQVGATPQEVARFQFLGNRAGVEEPDSAEALSEFRRLGNEITAEANLIRARIASGEDFNPVEELSAILEASKFGIASGLLGEDLGRQLFGAIFDESGNVQDLEETLFTISDLISQVENQSQRTLISELLFGEQEGKKLAPILSQGREAIEEIYAAANASGTVPTQELVELGIEGSAAVLSLASSFKALKNAVAEIALPSFIAFIDSLKGLLDANRAVIAERIGRAYQATAIAIADILRILTGRDPLTRFGEIALSVKNKLVDLGVAAQNFFNGLLQDGAFDSILTTLQHIKDTALALAFLLLGDTASFQELPQDAQNAANEIKDTFIELKNALLRVADGLDRLLQFFGLIEQTPEQAALQGRTASGENISLIDNLKGILFRGTGADFANARIQASLQEAANIRAGVTQGGNITRSQFEAGVASGTIILNVGTESVPLSVDEASLTRLLNSNLARQNR